MPTLNTTPNRGYEEPHIDNGLNIDIGRLISALRAIDTDVADAFAQIVAKANLASPTFTGVPTAPTAAPGTDTGQIASTAFVRAAVLALIDSSPGALDTLNELAAALGDDPNFAATITSLIGTKADGAATTAALALKLSLSGGTMTGDIDFNANDIINLKTLNEGPVGGRHNLIINGDGIINQRAPATNADDTYGHDRHYALTQTAAIAVSSVAAPADGIRSMMRLTQSQATAQRMGYAQILEATETYLRRGKKVTLGGKLRYSNAAAVRFAVLEWTGAADTVTSDVVASWTSAVYTAGNFFLASNLIVRQVGTITPAANTITKWSTTATIGSAANNIIVFFWTEGTAAQNSTLDMAWSLVEGDASQEDDFFSPRSPQVERALCQRFYTTRTVAAQGPAIGSVTVPYYFAVAMRTTPTQSVVASGASGGATIATDAGNLSVDGAHFSISVTTANGSVSGRILGFDAEL